MRFKVGDEVRWFSCSAGVRREKRGVVEFVIPARHHPRAIPAVGNAAARNFGSSRNYESYVVRARALGTLLEKPRLYWPRVKLLERCSQEDRVQEDTGGAAEPRLA